MKSLPVSKARSTTFVATLLAGFICSVLAACGDDEGSTSDASVESPCGFGDAYLPYEPGHAWSWRVVDLGSGNQSTKSQVIEPVMTDPGLGEVLVQRTTKATGSTLSLFGVDRSVIKRLRQEDFDELGMLQRTTNYQPGQTRLDQSEANTTLGKTWDEMYTAIVLDSAGTETSRTDRTESWEVLGTDVECTSPLGTFSCLHVRRQRTAGGVADKQYYYARGIGKVREVGSSQVEELLSCEKQ